MDLKKKNYIKAVAINSSPRTGRNTEILIKKFLETLEKTTKTE